MGLPGYGVMEMVKALTMIEEQVSEKAPYFKGQIPQGFEMFFGGYSSDLTCGFGRPDPFLIHLKESEWRFNHRLDNIYYILLKQTRHFPL